MNEISKAIILNSGVGKRMGELTQNKPKALLKIANGETLLGRQIRILKKTGINEIIITTGPFHEQINGEIKKFQDLKINLIHNDLYDSTNNIYSFWLIRELIKEDVLVLHGDLVFSEKIINEIVNNPIKNLVVIDKNHPGHDKDFKAFIKNDKVVKVMVSKKTVKNYHMQPIYKLDKSLLDLWMNSVDDFINQEKKTVYMEDALNNVIDSNPLDIFDMESHHYVDEVDTKKDYDRINSRLFDHESEYQSIETKNYIEKIENYLSKENLSNPLIVHGKHLLRDKDFKRFVERHGLSLFSEYSYNPTFQNVIDGVCQFQKNENDSIIAIAGGSGIDVAKAIKYYFDSQKIKSPIKLNRFVDIPLVAVPTTAGTGSESTTFSVIYYQEKKQSLDAEHLLPNYVILDGQFLNSLSIYQRKSTLLDAFCQSIESVWSVHSTAKSLEYALKALKIILINYESFILGDNSHNEKLILASNLAGKAINISKTTAPHAMSYAITSMKGISHGHAVSLTLTETIDYLNKNINKLDEKTISHLNLLLKTLNLDNLSQLGEYVFKTVSKFGLPKPTFTYKEIDFLSHNINLERLKNMPIVPNKNDIERLYIGSLL